MKFVLLFTILSLFIVACSNTNQAGNTIEKTTTKSVSLNDFKLPAISNEANQDLEKWVDFRSLIQVMVGMAPNKIKNADNFTIKNPDSLVTYKRLYPKSSKAILKNVTIDKDWRKVDGINDSIFRFQKRNNSELTYLLWKEYLLKDISYTFSIFLRNMNYPTILFEVSDEQKKNVSVQELKLDSVFTDISSTNKKIFVLGDNWKEVQLFYTPKNEGYYTMGLQMDENAEPGNYFLFYRPTLKIKWGDFSKIRLESDKLVGEDTSVKSSYSSIFFWLKQIDDELNQLLQKNEFPEKINTPSVKSRFNLFNTQIKTLTDNIQNNPDFEASDIKKHITEIQSTFSSIINRINNAYDNSLENKMQNIEKLSDTITKPAPIENIESTTDNLINQNKL